MTYTNVGNLEEEKNNRYWDIIRIHQFIIRKEKLLRMMAINLFAYPTN